MSTKSGAQCAHNLGEQDAAEVFRYPIAPFSDRKPRYLNTMLDQNALQQLKQLKTDIIESKDQGEGEVRGSQRRFGFVRLDDGRDVFLPPDEMLRVFPGDRVKVNVLTDDKGKFKGELEKLVNSPLTSFTGRYIVRGQGHFVEPDLPRFNKLLFIPPSERKKAQPGDYLHCKVHRHPWKDGKSQVKVLSKIGSPEDAGVEGKYTLCKFELPFGWPAEEELIDSRANQREDLRDTPFVTIDSASTRDIDDAIYAEANDAGWTLQVAVADPGAYIEAGSELDRAAQQRASTVYLPGCTQPMLPERISQDLCSLAEDVERAALVCSMQISQSGEIKEIAFSEALIRSRAKLSYDDVAAHLAGGPQLPHASIEALHQACGALRKWREENALIMPEQADFHYDLDEQGRITAIVRQDRNDAHRLVEECMLAANRSAALWLREKRGTDRALYNGHAGFREERLESIGKLVDHALPEYSDAPVQELDGYRRVLSAASKADSPLPLRSIMARMLQPGELSAEPRPHFGLGFDCYSTFTSPLRKYNDLVVQRCIRACLDNTSGGDLSDDAIAQLQEKLRNVRQASRQMEQWLQYQYLAKQPSEQTYAGHIAHLNGGGFTVELHDSGISGFVEARSIPEKLSFDADTLRLYNDQQNYQLEQAVTVKVAEIDPFQRKLLFTLA